MGELGELSRRLPEAIAQADDRRDLYAATSLRMGAPNLIWLAQDRPHHARAVADDAIAQWPPHMFLVQHYLHLLATAQVDLYTGDVWAAWRKMRAAWPRLRRAYILGVGIARVELRHLRARAAIAAATTAAAALPERAARPDPDWPATRLLRFAARDAQRLERERLHSARVFAPLLRAGIAAAEGSDDEACRRLSQAAAAAEETDMGLYAAAARFAEGRILGGDRGSALVAASEAWMRLHAVDNPRAMTAMLIGRSRGEQPQRQERV